MYTMWKKTAIIWAAILAFLSNANAGTEVYFSPNGMCEKKAVEMIDSTKTNFDLAMYSLNNTNIVGAIERAQKRGVKIRILLDRTQAFVNRRITERLKDDGLNFRVHSHYRIQHNKFGIFDGKEVMTGSFNWTRPAQESNEENCLFLSDKEIVQAYQDRFINHLWKINTADESERRIKKSLR